MNHRSNVNRPDRTRFAWRTCLSLLIVLALFCLLAPAGLAAPVQQGGDDPDGLLAAQAEELARSQHQETGDDPERDYRPKYTGIATGNASRRSEVTRYAWPFSLRAIGHTIASYQSYGGTPYFHHGLDILGDSGTAVYNRSGGQVVNIENYRPGNDLYWEVAVLDSEGYIWQYHHIEVGSIPQAIYDKWYEYQANPTTGGFIPANTYIGNIVYWPTVTFGERFNHIHLNILGAGGAYVNGFAFHDLLADTAGPQIQAIGLLQNGSVLAGNQVSGNYGMYVRARDLILHTAYYVPPYEITYSVDGGPETTTWRFDNLPGGSDNEAYATELYVVPPTCGNYDCRDFYINLGFATGPDRTFPSGGGQHTIVVTIRDDFGNVDSESFTWTVFGPPSGTVIWSDDFETNQGWTANPYGTDTATLGQWERGNPEDTNSSGAKQLGTTVSGSNDLVTGRLAGSGAGSYDIDNGATTIRSPAITLPNNGDLTLSFYYYLAHSNNSSAADYLRVKVVGSTTTTVLEEVGAADDDDASWSIWNASLNAFAGQTVRILVEAADASGASLVEAAIDDVVITTSEPPIPNDPPVADSQAVATDEDVALGVTLTASDPNGDPLTFTVVSGPTHGSLSGTAPNLVYTPAANFNGADSYTFTASDGQATSNTATVAITVNAVNDAPVASAQSLTTVQDIPIAVTLVASDVDGDVLSYQVVGSPANGSLNGTAPNLTYTPNAGFIGGDSFTFTASDGSLGSNVATVSITVNPPGPTTVFADDFETNQGWVVNPNGTDTATLGLWERANPQGTSSSGTKQRDDTVSGSYDLVTGPLAGSGAGSYDVDGGVTSIRSPNITLPAGQTLQLTFSYYMAHLNNSSSADYLRVKVVGSTTVTVFQELGAANDDDAAWASYSASLNQFAGQTVYLLIEAADASGASLVEAAVDNVSIVATP